MHSIDEIMAALVSILASHEGLASDIREPKSVKPGWNPTDELKGRNYALDYINIDISYIGT